MFIHRRTRCRAESVNGAAAARLSDTLGSRGSIPSITAMTADGFVRNSLRIINPSGVKILIGQYAECAEIHVNGCGLSIFYLHEWCQAA